MAGPGQQPTPSMKSEPSIAEINGPDETTPTLSPEGQQCSRVPLYMKIMALSLSLWPCLVLICFAINVRYIIWFCHRFFPSKYNREIKSLKTEVERLLLEIIQSRKDCVEVGRSNSFGNDLLGMLLNEMRDKRGISGGFSLNQQLIMDEIKTFFFAGHDTTALLLTWTVMLLASNPTWQDKVRAEVREVCGSNRGAPSVDQLPKLTLVSIWYGNYLFADKKKKNFLVKTRRKWCNGGIFENSKPTWSSWWLEVMKPKLVSSMFFCFAIMQNRATMST